MSGRPSGCNHEDWPCCGCGEEPSQEEQHEQFESMRNPAYDGPMGIFTGMDEDDEPAEQHAAPMTDWEADTPLGQEYGDGFDNEG